ncbi:hypothetical protein BHU72_06125 [Desulfuribacillus stibiiarsenatis]|uniref:Phosphodiesterase n=1 Tax=Desulfuribacillus stibiiarsenatis TaxID=1390249 RepID=A0A1E5L544_9FIRM|nr:alkaline phosphatase family protein [Desulfuribacillus stibiiarsenatis]OEH85184.1 hypothetical protein BHU72_06125 [Desulfuribacillus stibiiarsenatis]
MKKVILLLVDSLLPGPLEKAMERGEVPNMSAIAETGTFIKRGVTLLPTMSCVVDSSIITGCYPDEHHVPGLMWYNPKENRIVDYGSSFGITWRLGFKQVLQDVIHDLHSKHLSKKVTTIYEDLEKRGLTTGNINFGVYRGKSEHTMKMPFLLNLMTKFQLNNKKVKGPNILTVGKLVKGELNKPYDINAPSSVFKRYGLNDEYTIEVFQEIVRQKQLPDFTMMYFPDLDQAVHKKGTKFAIDSIQKIDKKIGQLLDALGGPEKAMEETIWIILSDHGQTDVKEGIGQIPLPEILSDLTIHNLRKPIDSATMDVVICNNERLTYLYFFRMKKDKIMEALLADSRIDFVAHRNNQQITVEKRDHDSNKKKDLKLVYSETGDYTDPYNQTWNISGDYQVLDLHVKDNRIDYDDYPDALKRLQAAFFGQRTQDVLVVTAKPGYEFQSQGSANHNGGGSHGSLHRQDSEIPIIIGGTDKKPKYPRIVDLKKFILDLIH